MKSLPYIPALTGLRTVAVMMVCLSHLWVIFPVHNERLFAIFRELSVGVSIFFVLSGFLMGYLHYHSFTKHIFNIGSFYKKRIARIFPLYLLITFLVLLKMPNTFRDWVINVFGLKGYFLAANVNGIGPAWTVTTDITFYFFLPFIFLLWKKIPWFFQIGIFYLIGALFYLVGFHFQWRGFCPTLEFVWYSTFFGRAFEFLSGIRLGIFLTESHERNITSSFPTKTLLGVIIVIVGLFISVQGNKYSYQGNRLLTPWVVITNQYSVALGVLLFIWGLYCEKSILKRLLSSRLMVALGNSSYAFFLIHYTPLSLGLYRFFDNNFWLLLIGLWGISVLLYRYVETPIARWLYR